MILQQEKSLIKKCIIQWGQKQAIQGTFNENSGRNTNLKYKLAKLLVLNKIKKQMGLDRLQCIVNGAAPLSPQIRKFFFKINIYITICFGMTETVGGHIFTDLNKFLYLDENCLQSVGQCVEGCEVKIQEPDQDGIGELCCRGRNIFMGYFKDRESTLLAIDQQRFLHTQDLGKIDQYGNVSIVGRIKDIIITSGGENVAPQKLSDSIKQSLPQLISQVHIIGDQRKYLIALITLKEKDPEESIYGELSESSIFFLNNNNCFVKTVKEAIQDSKVQQLIQNAVDKGNKSGNSQVARVKKFILLNREFTVKEGELTSTLKIKRKVVEQKFKTIIDKLYEDEKNLEFNKPKL